MERLERILDRPVTAFEDMGNQALALHALGIVHRLRHDVSDGSPDVGEKLWVVEKACQELLRRLNEKPLGGE